MGPLDHPAASLITGDGAFCFHLFSPLLDMRPVVAMGGRLPSGVPFVTRIGAEVLGLSRSWRRSRSHHLVEGGRQQLHIMYVGSADGERQWDATPVD